MLHNSFEVRKATHWKEDWSVGMAFRILNDTTPTISDRNSKKITTLSISFNEDLPINNCVFKFFKDYEITKMNQM